MTDRYPDKAALLASAREALQDAGVSQPVIDLALELTDRHYSRTEILRAASLLFDWRMVPAMAAIVLAGLAAGGAAWLLWGIGPAFLSACVGGLGVIWAGLLVLIRREGPRRSERGALSVVALGVQRRHAERTDWAAIGLGALSRVEAANRMEAERLLLTMSKSHWVTAIPLTVVTLLFLGLGTLVWLYP